ncbi:DUF4292 domain-containing protein [Salegentibacter sp. F188]|uniref:DUF4292 domain-containing protein n=1 Tax=Autumnicola patrickiae TaxID=3075591 RepID=A0ABU3E0X7_9FLAO|nr:DUF4292 domain-containing protein [Salegentibacter sp. F188]MDT0689651.1 DUF4292 domain-containing protein [Salegentibacter sp. F188]
MYKRIAVLLVLAVVLVSCGGGRGAKKIVTKDAEAVNIIARHYDNEIQYNTVSGKLKAVYQDEEKTQSVNLSFRMEKDKAIWMSATVLGFPIAKVYITPNSVSYYEKISKSYFDGDFSLISEWLGTPLDFNKLQNLLIGQAIYDLREDAYEMVQSPRGYQFLPEEMGRIKKMFLLDPSHLKASAQQLAQESESRSVTVTYSNYQTINGKVFPENIKIIANEGGQPTNIEITYRSVVFDEEVSFPFDIPSGYDEISVK